MSQRNLSPSQKNLAIPLQEKDESDDDINDGEIDATEHGISSTRILTINTDNNNQQANQDRIDTKALNGLRGIAALHIMIFHSLIYSKWQINTLGSVQMPLFFLISGYIFGLSEGKTHYLLTKCCTELKSFPVNDDENDSSDNKHFDGKNYYQRRIARTLPLYYLTNLLCIPLLYSGHGWQQPGIGPYIAMVLTLTVTTTWFGVPMLLNGPSWFVSTIWFFYWIFPSLLPKLQRYTDVQKQKWIVIHYWIQLVVGAVLTVGFTVLLSIIGGPTGFAFNIGTFWPPSRLPVFIMGVLAGLLRNNGIPMKASHNECTVEQWRKRSNVIAITMIIVFVVISIINIVFVDIGGNLWVQLIMAWWQLQFINSLTFEQGTSRTYKILSSKLLLQLGRISYPLYLVHEPFIQYMCWFVYGKISEPDCDYDTDDGCKDAWNIYNDKRLMPLWCIPIVWAVAFILAIVFNRLFEEPMRKCLRPAAK